MASSLDLAGRLTAVIAVQQELLSAVTDFQQVLDLIARRAPEVTDGAGAIVEIREGDELVCRAASGPVAPLLGARRASGASASGRAVSEGLVMNCDDIELDDQVDGATYRPCGIRSVIAAPLLRAKDVVGALTCCAKAPGAFSDLDAYTLQLLAGFAASAFLQARAFEDRRLSEERYRLLFERNIAGVFRSKRNGQILDCNDSIVGYLGYASREELMSRLSWDLYPDRAERELLLSMLDRNGSVTNATLRYARKDGSVFTAVVNATIVPGKDGEDQLLGTLVEARPEVPC